MLLHRQQLGVRFVFALCGVRCPSKNLATTARYLINYNKLFEQLAGVGPAARSEGGPEAAVLAAVRPLGPVSSKELGWALGWVFGCWVQVGCGPGGVQLGPLSVVGPRAAGFGGR
jgi:hypothetical protein